MRGPLKDERGDGARVGSGIVFNVPASEPFLLALARAILAGDLPRAGGGAPAPEALPDLTILLPTRRAARALQEHFLDLAGGRGMLLPRVRAIAETNEDLSLISRLADFQSGFLAGDIQPAVGELERHLVITSLVMRWEEAMRQAAAAAADDSHIQLFTATGTQTAAQAMGLARELARLMDMVETENVSLAELDDLVPEDYSEHWQQTLTFLEIVLVAWPAYLREKGLLSQVERRNRLILAEAERIARDPPLHPIIVAGVTGSIPATAQLMRAVAALDNGAIVLPGLDFLLDEESWAAIGATSRGDTDGGGRDSGHPEHPQFGLKKLIDAIGVARTDISALPGCVVEQKAGARLAFVSEAMRPAATTDKWHDYVEAADRELLGRALADVDLIEAGSAGEEAEVVSLILREAAEVPGRTAALVTRDRLLARRVAVRLESWGIRVDDSAGRPFAKTLPGTFLDLVIETVSHGFAPVPLMALAKHPLTRFGMEAGDVRRAARALELAVFRGVYLGRGIDGVARALKRVTDGVDRLSGGVRVGVKDLESASLLVDRIREAFQPLDALFGSGEKIELSSFVAAHVSAAEAVSRQVPGAVVDASGSGDTPVATRLWVGEAGETAQLIMAELLGGDLPALDIRAVDYPDFYRAIAAQEVMRSRVPVHPQISIWGPFEARLQQPDVVVLGGLNEGSWPEAADPGPWLNRPMRQSLGLPQPEERIGYSSHDFTSLLGAKKVFLTRALKVDGAPSVASRWLMRIKALIAGLGLEDAVEPDKPWLGWAANRSMAGKREPVEAPRPCPPVAMRPRALSVSDVERWVQNPYAIFAARILNLRPLARLGEPPGAALRGSLVHAVLSEFVTRHGVVLPDNPKLALMEIARDVLARWTQDDRIAAFWVPRFERFADWFVESEAERRAGSSAVFAEVDGNMVLEGPAGPFQIKARCDRIDVTPAGIVITDYKTMSEQSLKGLARRAAEGAAPQLTLEAVIAASGGFATVGKVDVAGLAYISASGAEPPGASERVAARNLEEVVEQARAGLVRLIGTFDDETTAYAALRRPQFSYDYDDYADLARVGEWSSVAGGEEGEAG